MPEDPSAKHGEVALTPSFVLEGNGSAITAGRNCYWSSIANWIATMYVTEIRFYLIANRIRWRCFGCLNWNDWTAHCCKAAN